MKPETTISWQYATNFTENEKRWEEVRTLLIELNRTITKNALLTMTMIDECCEATDMIMAIEKGDRSEFLYKKAKEMADRVVGLEEAGNLFYKAFVNALKRKDEQNTE